MSNMNEPNFDSKQFFIILFIISWFLMPLCLFFIGKSNGWWSNNLSVGLFVIWIYLIIPIYIVAQKLTKLNEEKLFDEVTKE